MRSNFILTVIFSFFITTLSWGICNLRIASQESWKYDHAAIQEITKLGYKVISEHPSLEALLSSLNEGEYALICKESKVSLSDDDYSSERLNLVKKVDGQITQLKTALFAGATFLWGERSYVRTEALRSIQRCQEE